MKVYTREGAMVARKHCCWTQSRLLIMLLVTIACTQAALAQPTEVGEWQEPPGGYDWPLKATHASLMPDGQVLTWQGAGHTARLWNTRTGDFTCMPNNNSILFCSGHASLASGSLLVVGGGYGNNGIKDTDIFCYGICISGPWIIKQDMNYGRWYPTCTTLGDGRVLTVAGTISPGVHATIPEIYDPDLDTWSTLLFADLDNPHLPLYPFMFLLPSGKVFFAGPSIQDPITLDWETLVLDIDAGLWDEDNPILTDYRAHDGTASMYEPGKIIRIGGSTTGQGTLNNVELIDFNDPTPAWSDATFMSRDRIEHQTVLLADGTVLVIGGLDADDENITIPELYDPATNTWADMAAMSYYRYEHSSALLLPNGKVLSAGGNECNGNDQSSDCGFGNSIQCTAEVFAPPYLFAGSRPVVGFAPTTISYLTNFLVTLSTSSPIEASEIAKVSLVRPGSITHNFDQNQRYVPLNFVVIEPDTLSIEPPDSVNIAPPGYYMLFLISDAGVPSRAKFVQLQ